MPRIRICLAVGLLLSGIFPHEATLAQPSFKNMINTDSKSQNKNDEAAQITRAKVLIEKKAWASVIRTLEDVIKKNPQSAEAQYLTAYALDQQNNVVAALANTNQALKLQPNYPAALKLRIRIKQDCNANRNLILADYAQLEKLTPKDAWIYVNRATYLQKIGEHKKATEEFERAITLGGGEDPVWCYYLQSLSYRVLHDYKKALASISKAIALEPKYEAYYNGRANIYKEMKDYPRAVADFSKAIEINPGLWKDATGTSWANRGLVYRLMNEHEKAASDFTQAIKVMPQKAYLYIYRSQSYCKLAKYDKAIADANKALEISPNNLEAFQCRYQAESKSGDLEQALADFNTIQELTGSNKKQANRQPGLSSKKWQDIVNSYSKIIKMNPQAADSYYNRGLTYLCAGQWQPASNDFQKFLNLTNWSGAGSTSAILLNYISSRKSGLKQEAEELLKNSIKRNKNVEWPYPVLCYYRGQINDNQLLASTGKDATKLSDAKCYIGIAQALQGNRAKALETLNWVEAKGNSEIDEYMVALSFKKELQNSRPSSSHK